MLGWVLLGVASLRQRRTQQPYTKT
jgi:hypothetical protein